MISYFRTHDWPMAILLGLITMTMGSIFIYAIGAISRRRRGLRPIADRRMAVLQFLDSNDPERNLWMPSSRRTTAARTAEAKALYLAARELAIELGINPPHQTDDVEHDLLTLRQWCEL